MKVVEMISTAMCHVWVWSIL